jgi:branched-chain amino acid transport system permease protein
MRVSQALVGGYHGAVERLLVTPRRVAAFAVFTAVLPFVTTVGLATEILILGLFALSYNIMFGFGGLLSFGHALFFGGGAYVAAGMVIEMGIPLVPTLLLTLVAGVLVAILVGAISLRLSGISFAMVTLAFSQLGFELVVQMREFTGGADGLLGIYRPSLVAGTGIFDLGDPLTYYGFTAVVTIACVAYTHLLSRSLFGRTLTAIRTNEDRTEALGVKTYRVKVVVFTIAGGLAAVAGGLWSIYLRFISPNVLFWTYTGDAILYTLIGGMHSVLGPLLGATFLRGAERMLFETEPGLWNVLIGSVFVFVVLFERKGLVGLVDRVAFTFEAILSGWSDDE